jgi:tetratricopeptide (TPR) repeat protein
MEAGLPSKIKEKIVDPIIKLSKTNPVLAVLISIIIILILTIYIKNELKKETPPVSSIHSGTSQTVNSPGSAHIADSPGSTINITNVDPGFLSEITESHKELREERKELKKEIKKLDDELARVRKADPKDKREGTEEGLKLLSGLKFEEARGKFNEAVKENPADTIAMNGLGLIYLETAEYEKALELFEKALKINLAVYGEKHSNVAGDYNNVGSERDNPGSYNKAIEYFEKAIDIGLAVFDDKRPNVARDYNNIGEARRNLGEPEKAIEYYEKAYNIFLEVYGEAHPSTQTVKRNIDSLKGEME